MRGNSCTGSLGWLLSTRFDHIEADCNCARDPRSLVVTPAPENKLVCMKWRRGLLLAAIHLSIAVPVIVQQSVQDWPRAARSSGPDAGARIERVGWQESQTVGFDPCNGGLIDGEIPPMELAVAAGNLPVMETAGWPGLCPNRSRVVGFAARWFGSGSGRSRAAAPAILGVAIVVEWLVVGGVPLIVPRRWWREPGAFVTACTVVAVPVAAIPLTDGFTGIPAFGAMVGWVWWFGLLVWRVVGWVRRWASRRVVHA